MTAPIAPIQSTPPHSGGTAALDVLVIGAGQAGLAVGYYLRDAGVRFELVDRNERVGDSWRQRFDSLTLFTPRSFSHLPGLDLDGDQDGYATRDELAAYLERYRAEFDIPVRLGTAVQRLEGVNGSFVATLTDGSVIEAAVVIVATGAFSVPAVPSTASDLSSDVTQFTPLTYRNPSSVRARRVLVVGDGATGRQIALELASTHDVLLATGKKRSLVPNRILGRSIFWWLDRLGLLRVRADSRVGRRLRARDALPRRDLSNAHLEAAGIQIATRVVSIDGTRVAFSDGESRDIRAIVWATGYRDDTSWMRIVDAIGPTAAFVEADGRSPVPNLFFVGRPWQMTQSSGLLTGVGADAKRTADATMTALNAIRSRRTDARPLGLRDKTLSTRGAI